VIHTKSLFENYREFPKVDCGYCGSSSCISQLRRHCAGEAKLSDCIFFKEGELKEADFQCALEKRRTPTGPSISFVNPCPTAPELVTVEANLASLEHSKYAYFDMFTAEKIYGKTAYEIKISPSLGLARMEPEGRAIMGFTDGRALIRRAETEEDAFWHLSRFVRLLWAAVN
jgi:hypothetical protein